jgi:hypothetical protein
MPQDFGSGVTRTLTALQRQFGLVVFQGFKPPLDSEVNLAGQLQLERIAQVVRSGMHSGFLLDPMDAQRDFLTNVAWSNYFKFGQQATNELNPIVWANVNGWLIPVSGTATTEGDTTNRVDLWPPPSSDARIDLVFLEAWLGQVAPNPSTDNKPSASTIWKWGNVLYGGTNITDDLQDPDIGYETTERVQIQYRLRVFGEGSGLGSSVALDSYPDGIDDPNVLGQGTATAPVTGMTYTNMREALGDPGLWRAGDGDATNDLGTVDGYTYAIPVAAVFRRNTSSFVARTASGNANQNGAVNRNPISAALTTPADGTKTFLTASLTNAITEATTGVVQVANLVGSPLENGDINWASTFLVVDDEVFSIESVNTAVSPATMTIRASGGRGRWGTMAVPHAAGTTLRLFNWRSDGFYADQLADTDLLDLRRGVTYGEWDYQNLLVHNLSALFKGELRSSYKQSGIGDTQGPVVLEVDTLLANGLVTVPNQTEALDGPDGIRTMFSDGATPQFDVTMLLDNNATQVAGMVTQFDTAAATEWEVGAGFVPGGYMTNQVAAVAELGWQNGSSIFIHIGGTDGSSGARGTFRDGTERAVRFVTPKEYWKTLNAGDTTGRQHPVTMRFIGERATIPAAGSEPAAQHPGPLYPLPELNFEYPYIVLGGVLHTSLQSTSIQVVNVGPGTSQEIVFTGLDFDVDGDWYSKDANGNFENDPTGLTNPLFEGEKTLWGMLTNNGQDRTGASSEVYLVLLGDTVNATNNGVFRVIGAGTPGGSGYTTRSTAAANRLRVEFITPTGGASVFINNTGLTGECRSQYTHGSQGTGSGAAPARASLCIVLTDLAGLTMPTRNPWNATTLGGAAMTLPIENKMVLNLTHIYSPGRGGVARVPDHLDRYAVVTAGSEYLRQSRASIDATFPTSAGVPANETYFDPHHIQTWNRLSSLGLSDGSAPGHGGGIVEFTEQDRDAELFVDEGSKTVMFRPYLERSMTLNLQTISAGTLIPTSYPPAWGGFAVDGAALFSTGHLSGYEIPPEYMPRFGRQDIPHFVDTTGVGSGTFLDGLNHMFVDSIDGTEPQFNVIGGADNAGVASVLSLRIQTGSASGLVYGQWGAIPSGGGTVGYQGRLYEDASVLSSDLGRGMEGVQLPPFLGVARVYGVYDLRDYQASGGATFESNRITAAAGAPTNLLRTDADKQTVFIVEDGAEDATGVAGDHTYVIPDDAIDIELSGSYVAGETFSDLDYVVECLVFGFARGFIDNNNYVLARLHNGEGNDPTAPLQVPPELNTVRMVFPAAAPSNDQCYGSYDRTVYQGDPYMTRAGSTRTVSDYEHRYGSIGQADAFAATPPIQQYDANGATIPETPNARALEVLASVDFWTTLGTGKIGGLLSPGTSLDVGFTAENQSDSPYTRLPASAVASPWQVAPRAFSEGQKSNLSHGTATLAVVNNAGMAAPDAVAFSLPDDTTVSLVAGTAFAVGANAEATATNIATAVNANAGLLDWVWSYPDAHMVRIRAIAGGTEGAAIEVAINTTDMAFYADLPATTLPALPVTNTPLLGGVDKPMNAAIRWDAASPVRLAGLTERLPMGLLLQDSDFIGEDPLRDGSSNLRSRFGALSAGVMLPTPLTGGEEYERVVGGVGSYIGLADGGIQLYTPYDASASPTGTRKFRLYRGGGSAFALSGETPGGPVDWSLGAFPSELRPVLKGSVLVGRAFLVRNFAETAFAGSETTTHGDELQMLILTHGVLGRGSPAWLNDVEAALSGMISPTGYGEGYAAADRYRIEGKPLVAGRARVAPSVSPALALFPFNTLAVNAGARED